MVTEGDRLRSLQVRIAGHDGIGVLRRLARDDLDQLHDEFFDVDDLFFEVELHVERHLIVTAARGMQALAVVADALRQLALDEGMDILRLHIKGQCAAFDIGEDVFQTLDDLLGALLRDDAASAEHGRMGDAALDILAVHTAVKADGAVEVVGRL